MTYPPPPPVLPPREPKKATGIQLELETQFCRMGKILLSADEKNLVYLFVADSSECYVELPLTCSIEPLGNGRYDFLVNESDTPAVLMFIPGYGWAHVQPA